jgi:hypothetical protein
MSGVRIDSAKLQAQLHVIANKSAKKAAEAYRTKLREEILQSGRVETGEMMQNIEIRPGTPGPHSERWKVIPKSKHFRFQNDGTRGTSARPGQVLRFKPKGATAFIFRASTGPIRAANFMRKAARRMTAKDFT